MEVSVGENIVIKGYTKEAESFFRKKLTFDNPEYYKKLNSGRWLGDTPQTLCLMQRDRDTLILPFGMLPWIFQNKSMFTGIYHSFDLAINTHDYASEIEPYDYQEEAIKKALESRQGVIVAPCGAGKTQIGLEIAARLGGRTLWLTHTHDLLKQSMERAKSFFGLADDDYGTITKGKVEIGKVITFATVQTMNKLELEKLRDKWDVVIVDECHHCVGTPTQVMMFYHVVSSLKARYKFGLTATPKRTDGLTPCMFALLGSKICEINREAVADTTCNVKVKIQETPFSPEIERILMPDGTLNYARFINEVASDAKRNEQIINDVVNAEGSCLILTDRIFHIKELKNMLSKKGVKCLTLSAATTKKAKAERTNAIRELNCKAVKVLIATYPLAKEGLDVPTLDNLFFATPQKNEIVVTQSAGRVARKAEGKKFGTIYDYEDDFSMCRSWQKKRKSMYKKLGYEIEETKEQML